MEGAKAATLWYLRLILSQFFRLVAADLEELRPGPGPYVSPRSLVICVAMVGFLALLVFLWLCALREKLLTTQLSKLMEEKHQLLEKASLTQKQVEGLESSLQEAISKKVSTEVARLKATYEELKRSNCQFTDEILLLEKELDEEKSKCSQQEQLKAELSKTEQSLQEKIKSLTSQLAEARENHLTLQTSETQLQGLITEALKENSERQARQKQLLQEAEALQTQVCELTNQRETLKHHVACAEEVLYDKEDHIWSLISRIAKMRDWAAVLGEDLTADGDLKLEMIGPENAAHLKIQPKSALEKLVYGAMLKACLQTMERERDQARTQLFEVNKTKRDLEDQMKVLHTKLASLQSQNTQAEQVNRLQQEVKILKELYLRNCRELITKLMAEEKHRRETEEEVCKKMEKLSHVNEELERCKKLTRDLEEKLEANILHHQNKIMEYEKDERLTSILTETTERHIQNVKERDAQRRRQLSELEEKYAGAPDVPHTARGGEDFPRDASTLGQASSTRSRRHARSLSRLFSKFLCCTRSSIPREKRAFTKQCFSSTAPKSGFFPPSPHYGRSELSSGLIPPANEPAAGPPEVQYETSL